MNSIKNTLIFTEFLKKKIFKKFINTLMVQGKKEKIETILFNVLKRIKKTNENPLIIFINAVKNASPLVIVKTVKKRKRINIIPRIISKTKQINYGILNIVKFLKKNKKIKTEIFFYSELIKISNNGGDILNLKKEVYNIAFENKLLVKFNKQIN
jgi:small subunit ribosomal protein S7